MSTDTIVRDDLSDRQSKIQDIKPWARAYKALDFRLQSQMTSLILSLDDAASITGRGLK